MANFFDQFDGEGQPSAAPSLASRDRDLAIRTIYGEAAAEPDEGLAAVAAVIRNRAQSGKYGGKDVQGVVMAPNQFEPWSRNDARNRMMSLKPDSPDYQRIGQIVDGVFGGQTPDPTNGATHFFAPEAQAALGRRPPSWAKGDAQAIGRHTFYAPEGRVGARDAVNQFAPDAPQVMAFAGQDKAKPEANFFDQFDAAPQAESPQEQPADPMVAAREQLAKGLKAGKSGDLDTYRTAAFRTNQGVPAAGLTEAAISGATGGFSDEASAAARAPVDMAMRGEGFDEAYQHNLAAERDRLAQYQKANPVKSTAAEMVGSFAMPIGKAGAIKTGLAQGALFGAGNSEGDVAQRAADAAVGGVASGALGGLVAGAGRVLGGRAPSGTPSIQELKEAAKKGYQSEAVKGLEIDPKAASEIATSIRVKLDADGFDDVVASKAHAILKKLEARPDGGIVTGQNLHSFQKTLGKAAGSLDPQENAAASIALSEFNKRLEAIDPSMVIRGSADDFSRTMKEANANYSAAMQSGKIDKKTVDATIRAGAANSGMNTGNTIRQRMADVAIRPAERRGLLPEEVATAERIAMGSRTENALRKGGNVLGGGGGMMTLISGAAGMGAAGAYTQDPGSAFAGLALPALGLAMRGMGNRMTMKQAEKLSEAIRKRAPLASATTKFEEKVAQFQQQRNAKNGVAAALAARNLATNLRGSGFNVSVSDLMRSLEGPAAGRAEDQPQVNGPPGQ